MSKLSFRLSASARSRFSGSETPYLLPVEVRKPSFALVRRAMLTQTVDVEPGAYFVSADLPNGSTLVGHIDVCESEDNTALLEITDEGMSVDEERAIQSALWKGLTSPPAERETGRLAVGRPAKVRIFEGNVLQGEEHYALAEPGAWIRQLDAQRMEGTFRLSVHPSASAVLQLLEPGAPPINVVLPRAPHSHWQIQITNLPSGYYSMSVHPQLREADTLIRYLERGFLAEAATMAASEELASEILRLAALRTKLDCSIASIVASYTLLRMGNLERAGAWIKDKRYWQDSSHQPDELAISGEYQSRLGQHTAALESFVHIIEYGLPVFSDGLSFVLERLRLYHERRTTGLGERLGESVWAELALPVWERLKKYAPYVDWNSPMLTFTGVDPSAPDDQPIDTYFFKIVPGWDVVEGTEGWDRSPSSETFHDPQLFGETSG